jgi:hypothetical protein
MRCSALMTSSISQLEGKIRDRINARRKQHELLAQHADWNRLCSALDVIGDTELALTSYLEHPPLDDTGVRYLHVYGALQLLQTQQDAASDICTALGIKPAVSPKVPLVRHIRSSSIGHPTRQSEGKKTRSNFIVRLSLSQFAFTLFTVTANESAHTERRVDIPELIDLQRNALTLTLTEVIHLLDQAEMNHREQHKAKKLSTCFPPTLDYYFSKTFEAIHSGHDALGKMHVDLLAECLSSMRSMLEERGEWGIHGSIAYEFELLGYPIERLRSHFTSKEQSGLNDRDAFIFSSFLQHRIRVLQQIALEIDERYDSSPENE